MTRIACIMTYRGGDVRFFGTNGGSITVREGRSLEMSRLICSFCCRRKLKMATCT